MNIMKLTVIPTMIMAVLIATYVMAQDATLWPFEYEQFSFATYSNQFSLKLQNIPIADGNIFTLSAVFVGLGLNLDIKPIVKSNVALLEIGTIAADTTQDPPEDLVKSHTMEISLANPAVSSLEDVQIIFDSIADHATTGYYIKFTFFTAQITTAPSATFTLVSPTATYAPDKEYIASFTPNLSKTFDINYGPVDDVEGVKNYKKYHSTFQIEWDNTITEFIFNNAHITLSSTYSGTKNTTFVVGVGDVTTCTLETDVNSIQTKYQLPAEILTDGRLAFHGTDIIPTPTERIMLPVGSSFQIDCKDAYHINIDPSLYDVQLTFFSSLTLIPPDPTPPISITQDPALTVFAESCMKVSFHEAKTHKTEDAWVGIVILVAIVVVGLLIIFFIIKVLCSRKKNQLNQVEPTAYDSAYETS